MKTNRVTGVSGFLMILMTGLAAAQDKPRQQAPPPADVREKPTVSTVTNRPASSDFPIIGYIEKRDRTITIMSGPKGAVYSVKNAAGKVLCDKVSLEQLRVQAPELHQFIKSAVAATSGKSGGVVDASVRVPRIAK